MTLFLKQYSPLDEELKGSVSNYWDCRECCSDYNHKCRGLAVARPTRLLLGRLSVFQMRGAMMSMRRFTCEISEVFFLGIVMVTCQQSKNQRDHGRRNVWEEKKKRIWRRTMPAPVSVCTPRKKTPRLTLAKTHGRTFAVLSPCYHLSLSHTHVHTDR